MKPAGLRRGALQPNGYASGSDGLISSICSEGDTGAGGDDTYSPHTKSSFPEKIGKTIQRIKTGVKGEITIFYII